MRVRHVVALVSDTGAFGGPVSVAVVQLQELASRGHDVGLVALWDGAGPPPAQVEGVPLAAHRSRVLVPGRGLLGRFDVRLLRDLVREARTADVLHIHAGRDLVTVAALASAAVTRCPFVVQTHGMVMPRSHPVTRLFDAVYLRLLRRAAALLALTDEEEQGLRTLLPDVRTRILRIPNGVARRRGPSTSPRRAVTFLARLHDRKRPLVFVRAALEVLRLRPGTSFEIYGPDEGELDAVLREVAEHDAGRDIAYRGPVDHETALDVLASSAVYVLPSTAEPFPMTLLEAMAAGTPTVSTSSCGMAADLLAHDASHVTDGSVAEVAAAVLKLLDDEQRRAAVTDHALRLVEDHYSPAAIAATLEATYAGATDRRP